MAQCQPGDRQVPRQPAAAPRTAPGPVGLRRRVAVATPAGLGVERLHLRREASALALYCGEATQTLHAESVDEGLSVRQALHHAHDEQRLLWHLHNAG